MNQRTLLENIKNERKERTSESCPEDTFSRQALRIRHLFMSRFNRMESQLEKEMKSGREEFATREELLFVISKLNEFRSEIQRLIETSVDNHRLAKRSETPKDDIFSGMNPFNLRKKYHQLSLKLRSEEVDSFGYDPVFDQFFQPLLEFFYLKYWRVETYGLEHLPSHGPVLLVGNHSGGLPYDATMLKVAVHREHLAHRDVRFMVEDFLFHFPFLGSLMNRFGGVRACQENAETLLRNNHPVVVFPEGVKGLGKLYREKYHLARFGRGGFVRLCLRTGAPIVPVAIIGAEEIHPMIARESFLSQMVGIPYIPITWTFPWLGPLGLIPLPSKWSIHLLPPIDFSHYGPEAEKDRVLVHKLSRMVKEQIQETLSEKIKERRSSWIG